MPNNAQSAPSPLLAAFGRVRSRLSRMAGSLLGSSDDADDALQDAFERLWTRRDAIRTESEGEALLTTAVRHASIDALRRRQARPVFPLDEERDAIEDDAGEEAQRREELFRDVEALIDSELSPTARTVLRLRDYERRSFDDIARRLGTTEEAVRKHLSRARQTIRNCYKQRHNDDD